MDETVKLLAIDLDGTVTKGNSWQRLNLAFGVTEKENGELYRLYHHEQAMTYQSWVDSLVTIFLERSKPTRQNMTEVMRNYELLPGAREAINALRRRYHVALVSGATDIFVNAVATDLTIDTYAYNATTIFNGSDELIQIVSRGEDGHVKIDQLNEIREQLGLSLEECACIGDSYSDLPLFKATGRGITFEHCDLLHGCCWQKVPGWPEVVQLLT